MEFLNPLEKGRKKQEVRNGTPWSKVQHNLVYACRLRRFCIQVFIKLGKLIWDNPDFNYNLKLCRRGISIKKKKIKENSRIVLPSVWRKKIFSNCLFHWLDDHQSSGWLPTFWLHLALLNSSVLLGDVFYLQSPLCSFLDSLSNKDGYISSYENAYMGTYICIIPMNIVGITFMLICRVYILTSQIK